MRMRVAAAEEMAWASITRPPIPLVYLDLNHYIELAKASRSVSGDTSGDRPLTPVRPGYMHLLGSVRRAKVEGRALFPLSSVHLIEVAHSVPSPRQRGHVADIMEELSDYAYLLGRPFLARMEINAALDRMYGIPTSYAPMPLLHHSALWAFGQRGSFKIADAAGNDMEAPLRAELGDDAYEKRVAEMNHFAERKLLEGPRDEEIPYLRTLGYSPESYERDVRSRLEFEMETSAILEANPVWRRGRLRDLISGRDIAHEWITALVVLLEQRKNDGLPHRLPQPEEMVALWAAMPQVQVAISMKTQYHRDARREWRVNDIADIDALAVAYAYCEALLTDRQARSALTNSRELRSFGAHLPKNVDEMADWLDGLPRVKTME